MEASVFDFCYYVCVLTALTEKIIVTKEQKNQFLSNGFIRLDDVICEGDLAWYRECYGRVFTEDTKKIKRKQLGGMDREGRITD